jgi:glycerol-3-phosphate dehydrogenase
VEAHFPRLGLGLEDVIATFAGVRPVIDTGQSDPSKESRDHVVWQEHGLLTVTGGKLTTFRLIALVALAAVRQIWPEMPEPIEDAPAFDPIAVELPRELLPEVKRRLLGRYGAEAAEVVAAAQSAEELLPIPHTPTLWAEVRWAARAEGVVHLEDLLLRRVRLGLLLPHGGAQWHDKLRGLIQGELGWDDGRWQAEWAAYLARWRTYYSLPAWETIPSWRASLAAKVAPMPEGEVAVAPSRTKAVAGVLLGTAVLSLASYWLLRRK